MSERIQRDHITADIRTDYGRRPDWASWAVDWYTVKLRRNGRQLTTGFGTGGIGVTAESVMECLCSDSASYDQSEDWHEWADDLGMDASPSTRKLYERVQRQARKLRRFLGDDYDAYLYETEG